MITKEILLTLFEGFSIQRWCDLVRPVALCEMDKGAEKLMIAFIIGKLEEARGKYINWEWIINAALFDFLQKLALCDIKEPLIKTLKENYKTEYLHLNDYVLSRYKTLLKDDELYSLFTIFLGQKALTYKVDDDAILAQRVYNAASKFASLRELQIIECVNEERRLGNITDSLMRDLQEYLDLAGLQKLLTKQEPFDFLLRAESLRFQTRWNQSPRAVATSVMGHSFFTAILTHLLTRTYKERMCKARFINTYFCALFHDLVECVTRDIISPVKSATRNLGSVIKSIERDLMDKELTPFMDDAFRNDILYYCTPGETTLDKGALLDTKLPPNSIDEFTNRVMIDGVAKSVTFRQLCTTYNKDMYKAIDGATVRIADHLSALLEAAVSIEHGVTSRHLTDGVKSLLSSYKKGVRVNGIDVYTIFSSLNPFNML